MDPKHPKMATSRGGHTAKTFYNEVTVTVTSRISRIYLQNLV